MSVNFNIIENYEPDFDYEDAKRDWIDPTLSTKEVREKYELSHARYRDFTTRVKKETGVYRKPTMNREPYFTNSKNAQYIRKIDDRFIVTKIRNNRTLFHGLFDDYETALLVRDKMVASDWDYDLGVLLLDKYGHRRVAPNLEKAKELYPIYREEYLNSDKLVSEIREELNIPTRVYNYLCTLIHKEFGNYSRVHIQRMHGSL